VLEEARGKDDSSKRTCRETNMWFVVRSRHWYPFSEEYLRKASIGARGELMGSGARGVRVAGALEDPYQQGAHDIVGGMNHVLSLAVLWGCVGTRHSKLDTMRKEEGAGGGVVKLTYIIALDTPDGTTKLRGYISEKVRERGERVRLMAQWKGP
jgi:hypothetical protein